MEWKVWRVSIADWRKNVSGIFEMSLKRNCEMTAFPPSDIMRQTLVFSSRCSEKHEDECLEDMQDYSIAANSLIFPARPISSNQS